MKANGKRMAVLAGWLFLAALCSGNAALADAKDEWWRAQRLSYLNWAGQATDSIAVNRLKLIYATINLSFAEYEMKLNQRLVRTQAASAYDYSRSVQKWIEARFQVASLKLLIDQLLNREKHFRNRADAALTHKESPKSLAQLNLEERKDSYEIVKEMHRDSLVFAREAEVQWDMAERLIRSGAISVEEHTHQQAAYNWAKQLQLNSQLGERRFQDVVAEAERELKAVENYPDDRLQ